MSFLDKLKQVVPVVINLYEKAVLKPNFKKLAFSFLATGMVMTSLGFTNVANAGFIDNMKTAVLLIAGHPGQDLPAVNNTVNTTANITPEPVSVSASTAALKQDSVPQVNIDKPEQKLFNPTVQTVNHTAQIKTEPTVNIIRVHTPLEKHFTKAGKDTPNTLAYASDKQDDLMALAILLYNENLKAVKVGNVNECYNIISSAITRTILENFHKQKNKSENEIVSVVDAICLNGEYSFTLLNKDVVNNPLVNHRKLKEDDYRLVNNVPTDMVAFNTCKEMVLTVLTKMQEQPENITMIVNYVAQGFGYFVDGKFVATPVYIYENTGTGLKTNNSFVAELANTKSKKIGLTEDEMIKVSVSPIKPTAKDHTDQIHFKADLTGDGQKIATVFTQSVNAIMERINNTASNNDLLQQVKQKQSI